MDELAFFSETSRQLAFERFELLRAHIEGGRPLAAIARETKLSYLPNAAVLAGALSDFGADRSRRRKLSAALQEAIDGLVLQKPPLPIRVLCNRMIG